MTVQPQVSVVMSAYNTAEYIGAAIDSVLNQTVSNLELIVVDDGSTDQTATVIERYLSSGRVYYKKIENSGSPNARNVGIKMAKAPYIAFIDSDDLWPLDKLDRQLAIITKVRDTAVLGAVQRFLITETGDRQLLSTSYPPEKLTNTQYLDALLSLGLNQMSCFNTILAPTEIIQREGLWDPRFKTAHDWENWLRLSKALDFKAIQEPLYFYRKHPTSTTRKNSYSTALRHQINVVDKYVPKGLWGLLKARRYKARRYEPFINAAIDDGLRFQAFVVFLRSISDSNLVFSRSGLRVLKRILLG
ncbi:glycosyltransferase family 2 protein [Simiduia aestuariiviva]|uniref:Glycosyltransferase involved in cell wall biosynthesis n=1 Tax=Simiduia aestuariiviva TaxID=1510459 RepID=A0A839UUF5_9GAMM|nr:glycosyltransferase family 2 protein [Simiduia aestuariiviva]MBB3170080.1 glycosyltransferase involved in cell wall biosynthesis [Simiduia aestuariiviva]